MYSIPRRPTTDELQVRPYGLVERSPRCILLGKCFPLPRRVQGLKLRCSPRLALAVGEYGISQRRFDLWSEREGSSPYILDQLREPTGKGIEQKRQEAGVPH